MIEKVANWIWSIRRRLGLAQGEQIPHGNIERFESYFCAMAEQLLKDNGAQADYSVDSIQKVEGFLDLMHKEYRKTKSREGLNGLAMACGSYITAVIKKHYGPAKWEWDGPEFGKDSFPLRWRESTVFPISWCQKRIFDGPADNVWTKFQTLIVSKDKAA